MKADGPRMAFPLFGWALAALLSMLAAAGQAQSLETDLCRSGGLGKGRGWVAATDGGAPLPEPDPIGGMGGTGARPTEDRAVTATVYGTVTRFGSICVNGIEIGIGPDIPVTLDGSSLGQAAIGLGQVVSVGVEFDVRRARATSVTIVPVVSGPVTARDPVAQRFAVMGRAVRLGAESMVALSGASIPEIGTEVSVSGIQAPDGTVVATRLESSMTGGVSRVAGIVRDMDGQYVDVDGVAVKLPRDALPPGLRVGESVSVAGEWSDGVLQASRITRGTSLREERRDGDWLSVEGYLLQCRNEPGRYSLGGMVVAVPAEVELAGWTGRRVVALGVLDGTSAMALRGLGISSLDDRLLDPSLPVVAIEPVSCDR